VGGIIKPIRRERTERQDRVARALASVRLEGLEPTEAARALFDRYAASDLSTREMATEISASEFRRESGVLHWNLAGALF
jgi:hypothetical protein